MVFFRPKIAGANQGELLSLMIPFSSILSTWTFISCLSAYGVRYWGRLMGGVSPAHIWCSMTSLHLKSLVSSSWNACAYFNRMDSINCFSSCKRLSKFPRNSLRYKDSFLCLSGLTVGCDSTLYFGFIMSTKDPATPRTVALGTTNVTLLKLANVAYAKRLGAPVSEWMLIYVTLEVSCVPESTRDSARAGSIPSIAIWAGSTQTCEQRLCSSDSNLPTKICRNGALQQCSP